MLIPSHLIGESNGYPNLLSPSLPFLGVNHLPIFYILQGMVLLKLKAPINFLSDRGPYLFQWKAVAITPLTYELMFSLMKVRLCYSEYRNQ